MSTIPYVAGEWYVVITCHGCQSRQPIFHDLTQGKANTNAIYTWTYPRCGHKGIYESEGRGVELANTRQAPLRATVTVQPSLKVGIKLPSFIEIG